MTVQVDSHQKYVLALWSIKPKYSKIFTVKFMFSKKSTKIEKIFTVDLTFT